MKVRRIIRGCTVLYDTIHLEGQEIYIYCYISVNIKKYKQLSCYPLECMNPCSSKLLEDDRILIRRLLTRYCLRSIKSKRMQCSYRIICISKSLSYLFIYLVPQWLHPLSAASIDHFRSPLVGVCAHAVQYIFCTHY